MIFDGIIGMSEQREPVFQHKAIECRKLFFQLLFLAVGVQVACHDFHDCLLPLKGCISEKGFEPFPVFGSMRSMNIRWIKRV